MARKTNSEKNVVSSGTDAKRPRRKAAAPRPKHSAVLASETETTTIVSDVIMVDGVAGPSQDQIARLAYLYWLDRGCQNGSAEEDWLRAEQALRQGSPALL
jgi:hypothetical protein